MCSIVRGRMPWLLLMACRLQLMLDDTSQGDALVRLSQAQPLCSTMCGKCCSWHDHKSTEWDPLCLQASTQARHLHQRPHLLLPRAFRPSCRVLHATVKHAPHVPPTSYCMLTASVLHAHRICTACSRIRTACITPVLRSTAPTFQRQ